MLQITSLDDIRGNNVVIYALKKLLTDGNFPHFTILTGQLGVGKSTVAGILAKELNKSDLPATTINMGLEVSMSHIEETVFKMNPVKPRAFVFEELHGLDKSQQTALLSMLDTQPNNVYIIATTTESHKILRTIKSRAATWDFKLLSSKQLSQLLDDYLNSIGARLSSDAKALLVRASRGVPRDLLKNTDLAISGEFSETQLEEILNFLPDDLMFSVFCSLKANSTDFNTGIVDLIDNPGRDKVSQLRDFYTRYLLERQGSSITISKEKLQVLDSMYTKEDLIKIGRTLIKLTPDTLILELALLNMELTKTTNRGLIGRQIDKAARNNTEAFSTAQSDSQKLESARISAQSIKNLHLGD